jgi:hypothetical protein
MIKKKKHPISAIEEKKREDKISLYLRADLSPAHRACPPRLIIVFSNIRRKKL